MEGVLCSLNNLKSKENGVRKKMANLLFSITSLFSYSRLLTIYIICIQSEFHDILFITIIKNIDKTLSHFLHFLYYRGGYY